MSALKEPMSSVDTTWLRMESPTSRMHIGAVLVFDRAIQLPALRTVLQERLLKFERFRQRVIRHDIRAWWEEDPQFSLHRHVRTLPLEEPASQVCLQAKATALMNTSLDFNHPLWTVHLVPEYQEGSALIVRIHHCIADGMSLIRVLLSLTDDCEDPSQASLCMEKPTAGAGSHHHEGIWDVLTHPAHLVDFARRSAEGLAELAKVTFAVSDGASPLKGPHSGFKQVAWAEPFALADVKRIGKKCNATVNDVLVAAVAGAVRQHMLREASDVAPANIHVAIPFNLRPLDAPIEKLGNEFGLVLLPLPVQVADPLERLRETKKAMDQLKHSYQAHVFYGLLELFGKGPSALEQTALDILSRKASAVMTNVPGPKHPVYLAGARLKQPLVWVPQAGNIGVGLAIVTYADSVQFGFVADRELIADPNEFTELFIAQFRILEMVIDGKMHVEPVLPV